MMFFFEREQYIYDIGGVKIGGNPGETPTVLAGTIFYGGHGIVSDSTKGTIDSKAAEKLINKQDEMSEMTGNPVMIQVFAESEIAMEKYLDFITARTDAPFLIDSTQSDVRIAGLRYAEEVGLIDRAIYNSINVAASDEEIGALQEIHHDCAVVLAFNPQDASISGRRAVLETGTSSFGRGLLDLCEEIGVTKPLIDTATTAMGAGAGSSASFTFVSKTLYGHPVGSGIHNAPSSWAWIRKHRKTNKDAFRVCDVASNIIVQTMGANFLLYGPIENADLVFPTIAMADILSAESAKLELGLEPSENHPYKKLL